MNILEEFWYGNIEPVEYDTSSGKEYKELLQLISRNEDKLLATMTEEQKELFIKYADCVREFQVMTECLLFQNSFRLGGRMMLEVMRDGAEDISEVMMMPKIPDGDIMRFHLDGFLRNTLAVTSMVDSINLLRTMLPI